MLCRSCFERLRFRKACIQCGRLGLSQDLSVCSPCAQNSTSIRQLYAAFFYESGIRNWIHEMKMGSRPERMAELTLDYLPSFDRYDVLIPVSSDPRADRRRGYNLAQILARRLSVLLNSVVLESVFNRLSFLSAQKELNENQRRRFLRRVIRLREGVGPSLSGKKILLVDDIMTTGASLKVHAELLKRVGTEIDAFCLARTPRYF